MNNRLLRISLILISIAAVSIDLSGQCPMCKIAAESNLENGGTAGQGLNTGILYMLAMPYVLIAVIGFVWYKTGRRM